MARLSIRSALVATAILIATTGATEPVRVSLDDAPAAINKLLSANQPSAAREIAMAALRVRPNDQVLQLMLAKVEIAGGRAAKGIDIASAVYASARHDRIAFLAARIRAEGHVRLEQYTRAQLWLRLASGYAETPRETASLARDYKQIKRVNPWSTSLRFGVTPSNNVNNGSSGSTFAFGQYLFDLGLEGIDPSIVTELSEDEKQLSGLQFSVGADFQYRLSQSKTTATYVTGSLDYRTFALSDEAKEIAPDAQGSDYENGSVVVGLVRRQIIDGNAEPLSLRANFGQVWFDGAPYSQFVEGSFSQNYAIDEQNQIGLNGYLNDQTILETGVKSRTRGVRLSWGHKFANDDRLRVVLHAKQSASPRIDSTFNSQQIDVNYTFAEPIAGLKLSAGFEIGQTRHPQSRFTAGLGARSSVNYGVEGSAQFTQFDLYGFQPVVTVKGSITESTVDLFDRENLSLGFDFRSSF